MPRDRGAGGGVGGDAGGGGEHIKSVHAAISYLGVGGQPVVVNHAHVVHPVADHDVSAGHSGSSGTATLTERHVAVHALCSAQKTYAVLPIKQV